MRRVFRSLAMATLLGALLPHAARAQAAQATITGRVTEAGTGRPIPSAQVMVVGTNLGTQTGSDGQFTIRGVTPGAVEVRVLRVGFTELR